MRKGGVEAIRGGYVHEETSPSDDVVSPAKMIPSAIMMELGRMNLGLSRGDTSLGKMDPDTRKRYFELNDEARRRELWGSPKDRSHSPIVKALLAIRE